MRANGEEEEEEERRRETYLEFFVFGSQAGVLCLQRRHLLVSLLGCCGGLDVGVGNLLLTKALHSLFVTLKRMKKGKKRERERKKAFSERKNGTEEEQNKRNRSAQERLLEKR